MTKAIQSLAVLLELVIVVTSVSAGDQGATARDGTYAVFPDVRLWYTDTGGTGTPIFLLHAGTGSSRV